MNRVFSTFQMRVSALAAALLIVAAALLVLGPSPGLAAVLYSTGFESDAASTVVNPDPSGDFDPAGFVVNEPSINSVQVASYVGAGGPPSVAGGSNYLRLTRPSGGYNVYNSLNNGAAPFLVKFDAYLPEPGPYGDLYVRIDGSSQQLVVGIGGAKNQFSWLNGGTWTPIPGAFVTFDAWRTIGIQVNSFQVGSTPGSYDLYYNNALVGAGIPYTATTGGQFEFAFGLDNSDVYYVDNFELSAIPEPASACLLGTGLVGLLACARRKWR